MFKPIVHNSYVYVVVGSLARIASSFILIHYLKSDDKKLYVDLMLLLTILPLVDVGALINFKKIKTINYSVEVILKNLLKKLPFIIIVVILFLIFTGAVDSWFIKMIIAVLLGIFLILNQYAETILARNPKLQKKSTILDVSCFIFFVALLYYKTDYAIYYYIMTLIFISTFGKIIFAFGSINIRGGSELLNEPSFLPVQLIAYLASNTFYIMMSCGFLDPSKQTLIDIKFAMVANTFLSILMPVYWSNLVDGRNFRYEKIFIFLAMLSISGVMCISFIYSIYQSNEEINLYIFLHFGFLSLYSIRSTIQNYSKKFKEQFWVYSLIFLSSFLILSI